MELVLIIAIIAMYYITKKYNDMDGFDSFLFDVIVQIFHIIILSFMFYFAISYGSIITYCFLPLLIYSILRNIYWLIDMILSYFYQDEDIKNNDEENNNDIDDNQNQKER